MDPAALFALDHDGLELDYSTPRLPAFSFSPSIRSGSPAAQSERGAEQALPLLQLGDWHPRIDDEPIQTCIQYSIEWKLQVKKRRLSTLTEITEENLALAPSAYWDKFLKQALATRVQDKLPQPKYEADETKITVSVEKRNERDLRKCFEGIDIEWKAVEDKLRAWSHLFRDGKKLRIDICFIYRETCQATTTTARGSTRTGASRRQLAARDALLVDQEEASGRRPVWKEVYELLRCNGPFCTNKGFYCWRHPGTEKHYKLETTVLEKLVDFAEEGNALRTHDDAPEDIRHLLREQDELLSERQRRKRKAPDGLPTMNINLCCRGRDQDLVDCNAGSHREVQDMVPNKRPAVLVIPKPRDEALIRYCQWHCDQVTSPTWKQGFVHAYQVSKEACLDLKHVHEAQDVEFYTKKGVKLGIAKSFVGDVYLGQEMHRCCRTFGDFNISLRTKLFCFFGMGFDGEPSLAKMASRTCLSVANSVYTRHHVGPKTCSSHLLLTYSLTSAKNSSIGFVSGEYGAKYISFTPASLHNCWILSE